MFTGIIDHCGEITELTQHADSLVLSIKTQFSDLQLGESIAVNGICLTVAEKNHQLFNCSISPETLHVTNAGSFKLGSKVNLERALKLGDRLGGHWVTGHVDAIAKIINKKQYNEFLELSFNYDAKAHPYIIMKGSVTLNGVSLTINEVQEDSFKVMLIPHTLALTNLIDLSVGDCVNLEYDWLVKIIAAQVKDRIT